MLPQKRIRAVAALWLVLLPLPSLTAQTYRSDARARALAGTVMTHMGGEKAWQNTRYLAWSFNNEYQVWDKQKGRYRWETGDVVAVVDTRTKEGKAYVKGQEVQGRDERQKLLQHAYARFVNNSYWLVMPFKLQDPGVRLRHIGEGRTMDGAQADVLELTFDAVGLTPRNKYHIWVDKQRGLVTQWAFFQNATDAEPTFTRRWAGYQNYGAIKLASDRSNPQSDFELFHIATPRTVPDRVFNSPTPIEKF